MSGNGGRAAAAAPEAAQESRHEPARGKGPAVWLDMDQAELDDAYDQAKYAANRDQILARCASNSELARARLGEPVRYAYGTLPIEGLDLFRARRENAPIQVFVHGGAWRRGLARDYAFPAELFVNAGAHFAVLDFMNVLETGGSLVPMADQVKRAIAWVYRNAARIGGDPERMYLGGHSSGAHLAGVALTADWAHEFGLPANIIKGAVCCSGMYDLKPVRLSARSTYVRFTDEMEQDLSSQRHLRRLQAPLVVAYGTQETPEFQRQARDFAAAVAAAGKQVQLVAGQGYNHFEMLETLANPYGILGRAALEQMGLQR